MSQQTGSKFHRCARMLFRVVEPAFFWAFVASSVASVLQFDRFRLGMLLTYSPRVWWLVVGLLLVSRSLYVKRYFRSLLIVALSCLLLWDLPIGGGVSGSREQIGELKLLSFNLGNDVSNVKELESLCTTREIALLCFQEVAPDKRKILVSQFPEFRFFHGDESARFEHAEPRVFSSLIGVRHDLLESSDRVEVFTGITGYRTFAIKAQLNEENAIRIANVHSTKPFTIYYGVQKVFGNAARKAKRHRDEKRQLEDWLAEDSDTPTIIAGDFNAPANSWNVQLANMAHSHRQSGSGPHLTFPRSIPFIGIDHVMANQGVRFTSSEIVDLGFSDHLAQIATFRFKALQVEQ